MRHRGVRTESIPPCWPPRRFPEASLPTAVRPVGREDSTHCLHLRGAGRLGFHLFGTAPKGACPHVSELGRSGERDDARVTARSVLVVAGVALVGLLGIALRIWTYRSTLGVPNADEAV